MTRLASIQLSTAGSSGTARAFLHTEQIHRYSISDLEQMLAACFLDDADRKRLARVEDIARKHKEVRFSVHPGETTPPEYHVYVTDPASPGARLFVCVLAPEPVIAQMLDEEPGPLFETATFQGMGTDTGTAGIQLALEAWMRRLWPDLDLPQLVVLPWPIQDVHSRLPPSPAASPAFVPRNAPALLDASDYPLPEELSA
jgi:hypothetical protein